MSPTVPVRAFPSPPADSGGTCPTLMGSERGRDAALLPPPLPAAAPVNTLPGLEDGLWMGEVSPVRWDACNCQ